MANTIKIKRGLSSNIDNTTLAQGELAITTDTNELYVGKESGKEKINVQANYSQNDEKAADYIKNRAIYKDGRVIYNGKVTFSNGNATITAPETLSDILSSTPFLNEKGEFILEMVVSIGGRESSFYSNKIGLNKYNSIDELLNIYVSLSDTSIDPIWSDESDINQLVIIYDRNATKFTKIGFALLSDISASDVDCKITIGVVSSVVKNCITSYNVPN